MKTFFSRFIAVVITAAIFDVLTLWLLLQVQWGRYPLLYSVLDGSVVKGGDIHQRFLEFNPDSAYDVIILGSSHAYRGYDCRIFSKEGISAFNLGSSNQTIQDSYVLAQFVEKKMKHKPLVLIETYYGTISENSLESTFFLIPNVKDDGLAIDLAVEKPDPRLFNALVLRYLNKSKPVLFQDSTYKPGGYCENPKEMSDSLLKLLKNPLPTYKPSKECLEYLTKLLKFLKEKGFPVAVATHPLPLESDHGPADLCGKALDSVCRAEGVPFLNFAFKHSLNSQKSFYDSHHMNRGGVNWYNPEIIKELRNRNLLR